MSTSEDEINRQTPVEAWCDEDSLHVKLVDGREISTPLWWYPSLLHAEKAQRENLVLMVTGIHWPDLDEDLSVEGMLRGWRAKDAIPPAVAAE